MEPVGHECSRARRARCLGPPRREGWRQPRKKSTCCSAPTCRGERRQRSAATFRRRVASRELWSSLLCWFWREAVRARRALPPAVASAVFFFAVVFAVKRRAVAVSRCVFFRRGWFDLAPRRNRTRSPSFVAAGADVTAAASTGAVFVAAASDRVPLWLRETSSPERQPRRCPLGCLRHLLGPLRYASAPSRARNRGRRWPWPQALPRPADCGPAGLAGCTSRRHRSQCIVTSSITETGRRSSRDGLSSVFLPLSSIAV